MRPLFLIAAAAAAAVVLAGCASTNAPSTSTSSSAAPASPYPPPAQTTAFQGEGSTFVGDLLHAWDLEFHAQAPTVQASYPDSPGGSGAGRSAVEKKSVFYGASDAPLSTSEKAQFPNLLQFPETIGPVAVMYNLAGAPDGLKLDGQTLGRM